MTNYASIRLPTNNLIIKASELNNFLHMLQADEQTGFYGWNPTRYGLLDVGQKSKEEFKLDVEVVKYEPSKEVQYKIATMEAELKDVNNTKDYYIREHLAAEKQVEALQSQVKCLHDQIRKDSIKADEEPLF